MNTSETLFFPSTVIERNKLDNNIQNLGLVSAFKKQILKFIRPSFNSIFKVHNPHWIKLPTRLRVGLSHLHEHKSRHNFQDSLDQFCYCSQHIKTTIHFFLHCSTYSNQRKPLFEKISNITHSLLYQNDSIIVETLFFGSDGLNDEENARIIESTIKYIRTTERFITPFLWIHLSKSALLLKSLIDSESPCVILFSCLVVQFYTYIHDIYH